MTAPGRVVRLAKLADAKLSELEARAAGGGEVRTRELTELRSVLQWCLAEERLATREDDVRRLNDLTRDL